ncbi:hypothetical protein JAAARDRAFT_192849 [Jaapia argillacea MUCL 33604]|uniref:Metal homeostatis protein bsd2 n=1 Tax=Jaapia argillacea MUCL 33604 TaxID=933084 RepID=A0A067PZP8_9AGAM|nr:hypothetical protein JAAARDRAFT_192849 [Jaapia argillacea MUCL 33604]
MDDAFESDDEGFESTPLTHTNGTVVNDIHHGVDAGTPAVPVYYDFERERDYDYPPPGSPPPPPAFALPNEYGNSNGILPSPPTPTRANTTSHAPRASIFRRAVSALLPTHYSRLPTSDPSHPATRALGGGTDNDGVFSNVMAKPTRPLQIHDEAGNIYLVPEEAQKDAPPTYASAQADAVPPYWETTVHAPDDLPTGSIFVFAANLFTSFFFQFVGFLMTYLLHTTHAAKYGSRAGLGLTLIQYGFYSRIAQPNTGLCGDGSDSVLLGHDSQGWPLEKPSETVDGSGTIPTPTGNVTGSPLDYGAPFAGGFTSREWFAFLLMTMGWFLLLSSLVGFWRVKRWESSIKASRNSVPLTPEDVERDLAVRRNLELVFGITSTGKENRRRSSDHRAALAAEERLARDLRAAGLL